MLDFIAEAWARFWAKPASVMAHFWAGGFLLLVLERRMPPLVAFVSVLIVAVAWEAVPDLLKGKDMSWTARAWDIPPWALGAILGWVL